MVTNTITKYLSQFNLPVLDKGFDNFLYIDNTSCDTGNLFDLDGAQVTVDLIDCATGAVVDTQSSLYTINPGQIQYHLTDAVTDALAEGIYKIKTYYEKDGIKQLISCCTYKLVEC